MSSWCGFDEDAMLVPRLVGVWMFEGFLAAFLLHRVFTHLRLCIARFFNHAGLNSIRWRIILGMNIQSFPMFLHVIALLDLRPKRVVR